MRKQFSAVLFDMDGTLVDNMMTHHHAWKQKLNELGLNYSLEQVRQQVHGINVEIIENLFPGKYSLSEREQLGEEKEALYREMFGENPQLIEGVTTFLAKLSAHNIPYGIGTAASPKNVDFVVDTLSIRSQFKTIVDSSMVKNGKPHPEVYEQVSDHLKVSLANSLVFEDTPTGAKAAANGGACSIIVTTTHSKDEFSGIDGVLSFIHDFSDLSFLSFEDGKVTVNV